jgi:site-specific DNA recombinase
MKHLPSRLKWVLEEFERLAASRQAGKGCLGAPGGRPSFAYLRVSSSGQAEEGRGGFPRQLEHVHDKALALGLTLSWELIFFDDHTGFEFRDRPALTSLRDLIRAQPRPADDLVIENLDRLSREATWQQGFLLDEIENVNGARVHFWKEVGSKLERVIYGTISQDRMLTDLERMAAGNRHKAESGRVTARTPAYGYRFVNAQGGTDNIKKDTHYAVSEPEAAVVRMIYRWLVEERITLVEVSRRLLERRVKTPTGGDVWDMTQLRAVITNPVYKGEFYAHRFVHVERVSRLTGKPAIHKIERPRNEWILVPVPALVTPEVWEEARRAMSDHRTLSLRNAAREYLLVSLLYCADCGRIRMTIGGRYHHRETAQGPKTYESTYYRCANRVKAKHVAQAQGVSCTMPQIASGQLDDLVWRAVVSVLLDRARLEEGLERYFSERKSGTVREEIAFVQGQLTDLALEDEMLYQAYKAKAFDADEFAERRFTLKEHQQRLEETRERLRQQLSQQVSQREWKRQILASADELRRQANRDAPFDLKRRILMKVVDKIIVNTSERWFTLQGAISGTFDFDPADRGSWPRSG